MILLGSIANAVGIIIGGLAGSILKKGLSERFGNLILAGLGLFTFALGVRFSLDAKHLLVVIFSLVIGALIGESIDIEKRMENLGNNIQDKLKGFKGNFAQGFVTASVLYCVGSMAIMGSLQSGLSNKHDILFAKSVMDMIISVVFASTMGIGVAAAAVPVFIYQGTLTLLASFIAPYVGTAVVTEMTATGGILLMAIGINILEIKKIKVGNLIPAIFIPIILMIFVK